MLKVPLFITCRKEQQDNRRGSQRTLEGAGQAVTLKSVVHSVQDLRIVRMTSSVALHALPELEDIGHASPTLSPFSSNLGNFAMASRLAFSETSP